MKALPVEMSFTQYTNQRDLLFKNPKRLIKAKNINDLAMLVVSKALNLSEPLFNLGVKIIQTSEQEGANLFVDVVMGRFDEKKYHPQTEQWFLWLDMIEYLDRQSCSSLDKVIAKSVITLVKGFCNDRQILLEHQKRDILIRINSLSVDLPDNVWYSMAIPLLLNMPALCLEYQNAFFDKAQNILQSKDSLTSTEQKYLNAWCYAELLSENYLNASVLNVVKKQPKLTEELYIKIHALFLKESSSSDVLLSINLQHFKEEGGRLISVIGHRGDSVISLDAEQHLIKGVDLLLNKPFDLMDPNISLAHLVRCLSWVDEEDHLEAINKIYDAILYKWLQQKDRLSIIFNGLMETPLAREYETIHQWRRFGQQLSVSEVVRFMRTHNNLVVCPQIFIAFLMSCQNTKMFCKDSDLVHWMQLYLIMHQDLLFPQQGKVTDYEIEAMCFLGLLYQSGPLTRLDPSLLVRAKIMVKKFFKNIAHKPDIAIYPELKTVFELSGLGHLQLIHTDCSVQEKLTYYRVLSWMSLLAKSELDYASCHQIMNYLAQNKEGLSHQITTGVYLEDYYNIGMMINIYELLARIPESRQDERFEQIAQYYDQLVQNQMTASKGWRSDALLSFGMTPVAYQLMKKRSNSLWGIEAISHVTSFLFDVKLMQHFLATSLAKAQKEQTTGILVSTDLDDIIKVADQYDGCLSLLDTVINSGDYVLIFCILQHIRRLIDTQEISQDALFVSKIQSKRISFEQDIFIGLISETLLLKPMTISKQRIDELNEMFKNLEKKIDSLETHVTTILEGIKTIDGFQAFSFGALFLMVRKTQGHIDFHFEILVRSLSEYALHPGMAYVIEHTVLPRFSPYLDKLSQMDRVTEPLEKFIKASLHWPMWKQFRAHLPDLNVLDVSKVTTLIESGEDWLIADQLAKLLSKFDQEQTKSRLMQLQKCIDGGSQSVTKRLLDYIQGRLDHQPSMIFLDKIKTLPQCEFVEDFSQLSLWARWARYLPLKLICYLNDASSSSGVSIMIQRLIDSWALWKRAEVVDFLEQQISPRIHNTLQSMPSGERLKHLSGLKELKLCKEKYCPRTHSLIQGKLHSVV